MTECSLTMHIESVVSIKDMLVTGTEKEVFSSQILTRTNSFNFISNVWKMYFREFYCPQPKDMLIMVVLM